MEIDIDKYTIKSDPQNLWIEKRYWDRNGKVQVKRIAGYARTLEELYTSFVDARVRGCEARTVKELLEELKVIRAEVLAIARKETKS